MRGQTQPELVRVAVVALARGASQAEAAGRVLRSLADTIESYSEGARRGAKTRARDSLEACRLHRDLMGFEELLEILALAEEAVAALVPPCAARVPGLLRSMGGKAGATVHPQT